MNQVDPVVFLFPKFSQLCLSGTSPRMRMKKSVFIFLLLLFPLLADAQDALTQRYAFLEVAGSGGLGSLNYERPFLQKNNSTFTGRVGFSIAPIDKNNGFGLVFPVMANVMIGKNAHKLEAGLGQGITFTTKGSFFVRTTAALGYRYQPAEKRIFYRVTYTPLISYLIDFQVEQWFGASIGFTFHKKAK